MQKSAKKSVDPEMEDIDVNTGEIGNPPLGTSLNPAKPKTQQISVSHIQKPWQAEAAKSNRAQCHETSCKCREGFVWVIIKGIICIFPGIMLHVPFDLLKIGG